MGLSMMTIWRGGRAVECGGLENRFTLTGNGGSNPSLSADIDEIAEWSQRTGTPKTKGIPA